MNSIEKDINLIIPEKGGAGLCFGDSIDDLVALWGKPAGIYVRANSPYWTFSTGSCSFTFLENRLVSMSIHRSTVPDAYFKNGINFKSSQEDVKDAFGTPVEQKIRYLKFQTGNGCTIQFYWGMPSEFGFRRSDLVKINITHPDFYKTSGDNQSKQTTEPDRLKRGQ